MKLTDKEKTVLKTLNENKDHAPALGVDEMSLMTDYSQSTIKGIVGSLKKKGLVDPMKVNGVVDVTYITDKGVKEIESK